MRLRHSEDFFFANFRRLFVGLENCPQANLNIFKKREILWSLWLYAKDAGFERFPEIGKKRASLLGTQRMLNHGKYFPHHRVDLEYSIMKRFSTLMTTQLPPLP